MTAEAPIDPEFARRVAGEWFDAWNRHDLEAVLGHYADDVEFIRSVRDLEAAETMFFGADAKIVRVVAHYEAQARGD